jgi:hypothetical protein
VIAEVVDRAANVGLPAAISGHLIRNQYTESASVP